MRPTSRARKPPELSDVWPERAVARDGRISSGVVQSRYCAPQEGQGSYMSVLESQRNAISGPDRTPSPG